MWNKLLRDNELKKYKTHSNTVFLAASQPVSFEGNISHWHLKCPKHKIFVPLFIQIKWLSFVGELAHICYNWNAGLENDCFANMNQLIAGVQLRSPWKSNYLNEKLFVERFLLCTNTENNGKLKHVYDILEVRHLLKALTTLCNTVKSLKKYEPGIQQLSTSLKFLTTIKSSLGPVEASWSAAENSRILRRV